MTYTKRDDLTAQSGETVVQLDTGPLVAVSCERKLLGDRISFHTRARVVGDDGRPVLGSDGNPVIREFKHSTQVGVEPDEVTRQCLLAALGEPCELGVSASVTASYSIRVALDAAQVVGAADAGAVL